MRSRRIRKRFERVLPKPSLVIEDNPTPRLSLENAAPSRARERQRYERTEEDDAIFVKVVESFMDAADMDYEVRYEHAEYQRAFLEVDEARAGALIGKRGAGIDALELILSRMASHQANRSIPVQVDVNGYRAAHEEDLRERARSLAARVLETGADEHLPPMGARDRRVVHLTVQEMEGLETFSLGDGATKHIVIHRTTEKDA